MKRSSILRDVVRALSWHRRKLAVVAAIAAVLSGISAASPPAAPSATVVVTRAELGGGATIGAGDVQTLTLPSSVLPDQVVTDPTAVIGRTLVAPLPAGSVLTQLSVLSDRTLTDPGQVIAPVRVSDASIVALLRVGDRIDVVLADQKTGTSSIVARDVRVVTLPQQADTTTLGAASTSTADGAGQLVLLAVSETQATALTQASADQIGVILH